MFLNFNIMCFGSRISVSKEKKKKKRKKKNKETSIARLRVSQNVSLNFITIERCKQLYK